MKLCMWFLKIVWLFEYNVNGKYVCLWIIKNIVWICIEYNVMNDSGYVKTFSHTHIRKNEDNDNVMIVGLLKGFPIEL